MTAPFEPPLDWRKASASNGGSGNCVEAAKLPDGRIALRDSKNPDGPLLIFSIAEWSAFEDGMGKGEFAFLLNT